MTHNFIIMWDSNGLEYIADITADEQRVMWEKLQGRDAPRHAIANPFHLRLRAQANPQRNYQHRNQLEQNPLPIKTWH